MFLARDYRAEEIFTREDLSSAQQMFGSITEDFMRTKVLPRADEIYSKDWSVTRELLLKAGDLDLLRVDIPEEYGGLGLDKVSSAFVGEKIGIFPSFAGSLGAHTTIGTLPLVYFGTPAQKEKYLPRLASGEMVAAFCLTEPGSGSDALAARTRDRNIRNDSAEARGDGDPLLRRRLDGVPHARRHGSRDRSGRRRAEDDRVVRGRVQHQQGVDERVARVRRRRGSTGVRRLRLFEGVSGRARVPRRAYHAAVRGDERNQSPDHPHASAQSAAERRCEWPARAREEPHIEGVGQGR